MKVDKVYLVVYSDYDIYNIVDAKLTREEAEESAKIFGKEYGVDEYEIRDEMPEKFKIKIKSFVIDKYGYKVTRDETENRTGYSAEWVKGVSFCRVRDLQLNYNSTNSALQIEGYLCCRKDVFSNKLKILKKEAFELYKENAGHDR